MTVVRSLRRRQAPQIGAQSIERCAVTDVADQIIRTISKGYRQRVGLSDALLDEPDEINRQLERYLAVSAADVREACAELLVDHNRVVMTYIRRDGATSTDVEAAGSDDEDGPGGPLEDGMTEARA